MTTGLDDISDSNYVYLFLSISIFYLFLTHRKCAEQIHPSFTASVLTKSLQSRADPQPCVRSAPKIRKG